MCHADIITDQPQEPQRVRILPKLQTGFEVYGVDDEVAMDMVSIAVGGDKNLRAGPGTGSKVLCNLMGLLGCDILCW